LTYTPVNVSVIPDSLNVGAISNGTSKDTFLVITNWDSINAVIIYNVALKDSAHWILIPPMTNYPDTLVPLAADTVYLQYTASNNQNIEVDYDSLVESLCMEFPPVKLIGKNKPPVSVAEFETTLAAASLSQNAP